MKIDIVCSVCGSQDVRRDAWAEWDTRKQEWVLENVFDASYCMICDEDHSLEEKEIVEEDVD